MTASPDQKSQTARREWVFQGTRLRAFCDNPDGAHLRVKFNYLARSRQGFDALTPVAAAFDPSFAQIQVQTSRNDYYLNDELPMLRAALAAYCHRFDRREAMGFSMGGFGAVLLARAIALQKVLLISPVSETSFRRAHSAFDPPREAALFAGDDPFAGVQQDLHGVILCDPQARAGRDLFYARFLQGLHPRLHILALPWAGHPATKLFSETRSFGQLRSSYFDGTITPLQVKSLQRSHRMQALRYTDGLLNYMLARGARG